MATYMNQTNSGRIIVQQTSPSAIIVQPDNERKIILKGSGGLKGETGEQGPAGPQGEQGPQGPAGQPGPANTLSIGTVQKGDTAEATITGTAPNQTLNLTLPKGDKGDTGSQGPQGPAATIAVGTTSTLPEGSSATVTNSGTSSAAVFNFGIPKGDKGDTGETGETGPTGPAGPGVVSGGSTGQVLTKKSGTNYDTEWTTPATYSDFTGATSSVAGAHGLVPAPTTSDPDKFLKGDGTWGTPPGAAYTGGTGIDIVGNVVSVDNTVAMQSDLPTKTSDLINDGSDNTSTYVEADELATVATSGSYSDLLNKPTIPTVNDATLTIQKNGTTVETFTANSSTNKTVNIAVPTKTSDLTNDGADGTSTYVEATDLNPGDVSGEGTSITLPGTQGGRFSEVKLKGNTEQATYSGKNLITLDAVPDGTGNGVAATFTGSEMLLNGTTTSSSNIAPIDSTSVSTGITLPAGTYTFSIVNLGGTVTAPSGDNKHLVVYMRNSSGTALLNWSLARTPYSAQTKTFTAATTIQFQLFSNSAGFVLSNFKLGLQIESGSTATSYEPYVGGTASPNPSYPQTVQVVTGEQTIAINDGDQQSQTYTINLGKNIVDLSMINVEYGIYTDTGALGSQSGRAAAYKVPVKPNTSYIATCAAGYQIGIGTTTYGANGAYTGYTGSGWATTKTYTTDANTYFISFVIKNDAGTSLAGTDPATFKLQMEEGSTSTAYTPHVELCKIGDYQDYIYKNNGTWYLHKVIGKLDLATQSWSSVALGTNTYGFGVNDAKVDNSNIVVISDSFLGTAQVNRTQGNNIIYQDGAVSIIVRNTSYTSVSNLVNMLTANDAKAYYVLATPLEEEIPGALLDDLNAFDQATSYNGNTYITVSSVSPDLPATLSVAVEQESALPVATETSVGVVSVGDGLSITEGGVLSVNPSKKEVYSTNEQIIGTWINGKPLYRKTVDCGKGPNAGRKDVAAGISNPDLIVNLYGFSVDLGTCTPVNNARPDNTAAANGAYFENGNIVIRTGVDRTPATFYITVEYTKTTD